MKKCKVCGTKFKPIYSSVQMVCSPKCAIDYKKVTKSKNEKILDKAKKERKEVSDMKKSMKNRGNPLRSPGRVSRPARSWNRARNIGSVSIQHRYSTDTVSIRNRSYRWNSMIYMDSMVIWFPVFDVASGPVRLLNYPRLHLKMRIV